MNGVALLLYTGFLISLNALEGGELVAIAFESSEPVETKVNVIEMVLLVGYIYLLRELTQSDTPTQLSIRYSGKQN